MNGTKRKVSGESPSQDGNAKKKKLNESDPHHGWQLRQLERQAGFLVLGVLYPFSDLAKEETRFRKKPDWTKKEGVRSDKDRNGKGGNERSGTVNKRRCRGRIKNTTN